MPESCRQAPMQGIDRHRDDGAPDYERNKGEEDLIAPIYDDQNQTEAQSGKGRLIEAAVPENRW